MRKYFLISKSLFALSILLLILSNLLWSGLSLLLRYNTDTIIAGNLSDFKFSVMVSVVYLSGFLIVAYLSKYVMLKVKAKFFINLKSDILNSMQNYEYQKFYGEDISAYISNFTNDINIIELNYFDAFYRLLSNIFLFIFTIYVLFSIHYIVLIVIAITGSLMFMIPVLNKKLITSSQDSKSQYLKDFNSILRNVLSGFEVLNSFNKKEKFFSRIKLQNQELEASKFAFERNKNINENAVLGLALVCQFSGIFTSGYLVIKNVISAGSIIAVIQLGNQIYNSLSASINSYMLIASTKNINEKLFERIELSHKQSSDNELNSFNSLQLKNISFGYSSENEVLKNLSYEFLNGKKYLITGENGGGKSTLIKLIAGYFNGYTGDIKLNGDNISDIVELRRNSSVIHQNVYLFNISIMDNITLYDEYDKTEIVELCKAIKIHDYIMSLEKGYDTVLDENSNMLSGGQKQKIVIVRALIRKSNILLLDEYTSALDVESTQSVNDLILNSKDKTIISISHDLDSEIVGKYDYVLKIENGTICE